MLWANPSAGLDFGAGDGCVNVGFCGAHGAMLAELGELSSFSPSRTGRTPDRAPGAGDAAMTGRVRCPELALQAGARSSALVRLSPGEPLVTESLHKALTRCPWLLIV